MCARLRAPTALGKITTVDHIWHKAPCSTWHNLGCFLGWHRKRKMQESGAWQVSTAVWNDVLFTALAAHAVLLLHSEVASRRASGLNFDKDELVVVVCAAIRSGVGPFQAMGSLFVTQTRACTHMCSHTHMLTHDVHINITQSMI